MNITRQLLEHLKESNPKDYNEFMSGNLRLQSPEETFVVSENVVGRDFEVLAGGRLRPIRWIQAYLRPKILR